MNKKIKRKYGHCRIGIESDYAHIHDLYIIPQYRGKGLARKLILKAIKEIRSKGYSQQIQIVADPVEDGIDKKRLMLFYSELNLQVFDCYM